MAEPTLRALERGLPRFEMRSPALIARQREFQRMEGNQIALADIMRARNAALDDVKAQADAILSDARAQAAAIVEAALNDARDQVRAMAGEVVALITNENKVARSCTQPAELRLVADIIHETATRHGISERVLLGRCVNRHVVTARHEAIVLAYEARPDLSLPSLGKMFGGRDHTSILYVLKKAGVYKSRGHGE